MPDTMIPQALTAAQTAVLQGLARVDESTVRPEWDPLSPVALVSGALLVVVLSAMAVHRFRTESAALGAAVPEGLRPLAAYLLLGGSTYVSGALMVLLLQLEDRGKIASEPDPDQPEERRFHLLADPRDPGLGASERLLVESLFASGTTVDPLGIRMSTRGVFQSELTAALHTEHVDLGLRVPTGRYAFLCLLFPLAAFAGGVVLFFNAAALAVPGAGFAAVALVAYGVGAPLLLGPTPYNPAGRRVRNLLRWERMSVPDIQTGAAAGSWELALGLSHNSIDVLAEENRKSALPTPYYYEPRYLSHWEDLFGPSDDPGDAVDFGYDTSSYASRNRSSRNRSSRGGGPGGGFGRRAAGRGGGGGRGAAGR
ncbi:DUF2207 domain-containing protein, partial [Nocardiopsis nanhaiensis]